MAQQSSEAPRFLASRLENGGSILAVGETKEGDAMLCKEHSIQVYRPVSEELELIHEQPIVGGTALKAVQCDYGRLVALVREPRMLVAYFQDSGACFDPFVVADVPEVERERASPLAATSMGEALAVSDSKCSLLLTYEPFDDCWRERATFRHSFSRDHPAVRGMQGKERIIDIVDISFASVHCLAVGFADHESESLRLETYAIDWEGMGLHPLNSTTALFFPMVSPVEIASFFLQAFTDRNGPGAIAVWRHFSQAFEGSLAISMHPHADTSSPLNIWRPTCSAWSSEKGCMVVASDAGTVWEVAPDEGGEGIRSAKLIEFGDRALKAVGVLSDGRIIAGFEGGQCSIFHTTDSFVISSREDLPVLSVSASEESLITCHGEASSGSAERGYVRRLRKGQGVELLKRSDPDFSSANSIWTVLIQPSTFVVISFLAETRVLEAESNFTDVTEEVRLRSDVPTVHAGSMQGGDVVCQVHRHGVRILAKDATGGALVPRDFPSRSPISLASCAHHLVSIALPIEACVEVLECKDANGNLGRIGRIPLKSEPSCLLTVITNRTRVIIGDHDGVLSVWGQDPGTQGFICLARTPIASVCPPLGPTSIMRSEAEEGRAPPELNSNVSIVPDGVAAMNSPEKGVGKDLRILVTTRTGELLQVECIEEEDGTNRMYASSHMQLSTVPLSIKAMPAMPEGRSLSFLLLGSGCWHACFEATTERVRIRTLLGCKSPVIGDSIPLGEGAAGVILVERGCLEVLKCPFQCRPLARDTMAASETAAPVLVQLFHSLGVAGIVWRCGKDSAMSLYAMGSMRGLNSCRLPEGFQASCLAVVKDEGEGRGELVLVGGKSQPGYGNVAVIRCSPDWSQAYVVAVLMTPAPVSALASCWGTPPGSMMGSEFLASAGNCVYGCTIDKKEGRVSAKPLGKVRSAPLWMSPRPFDMLATLDSRDGFALHSLLARNSSESLDQTNQTVYPTLELVTCDVHRRPESSCTALGPVSNRHAFVVVGDAKGCISCLEEVGFMDSGTASSPERNLAEPCSVHFFDSACGVTRMDNSIFVAFTGGSIVELIPIPTEVYESLRSIEGRWHRGKGVVDEGAVWHHLRRRGGRQQLANHQVHVLEQYCT